MTSPDPRAALADELDLAELVHNLRCWPFKQGNQLTPNQCRMLLEKAATTIEQMGTALRSSSPYSGATGEAKERAYEACRDNLREAWSALAMIRETVETFAPSGSVKAAEHLDGPTFMHEADALVAGILAITHPPILPRDAERETIEWCAHRVELECEENTPAYFASVIRALPSTPPREDPK